MTYDEARAAMIAGVSVTWNGRRYRIRQICEIPVAHLNSMARITKQGKNSGPTTHLLEMWTNANTIETAMIEEVSLA